MNTTYYIPYSMVPEMNVGSFSLTDFIYNPIYYTACASFFAAAKDVLSIYVKLNVLFFQKYWIPISYGILLGTMLFGFAKLLSLEDVDVPLTLLESEIIQYIHVNSSTGCTARMVLEYLEETWDANADTHAHANTKKIQLSEVQSALQSIQRRGMLLPVQTTLWVVSGN